MRRPVTRLGRVGNTVWGKNRYGQTCYGLVVPSNPRTVPQQANRAGFGRTGSRWGLLTDAERALWAADARNYRTHGRPGSSAPMTGFQRYMSVNAKRARQGLPPLRVPGSATVVISHLPLAIFGHPSAILPPLQPPPPRPLHRCPRPRVPMRHRSAAVGTPLLHRWTPFVPPCAPARARAGPNPPRLLTLHPKSSAPGLGPCYGLSESVPPRFSLAARAFLGSPIRPDEARPKP